MRKIKDFLFYRKIIKKNIKLLNKKHDLKKDWVYRLYKLYTFNEEDQTNIKIYGEKYVETIIKKEIKKIDETIVNLKLYDLIGIYEYIPFPENKSVGILLGFKEFNTAKIASRIIWSILLSLLLVFGYILYPVNYIGLLYGGASWLITYIIAMILKRKKK